ncbi:MAG: DUF971 domain-containing protein [Ignavibacteria bacterium]|jgi:DUF971 family protein|nr:DUF971 domain-containing protein [Ignavibacteria bacterium]
MSSYYPTQIKRIETMLKITWNDGKISDIPLTKLRDECPCVNCKGESVIFESYIPIKTPFKAAGYYEIESIEAMGNYAVSIKWKDGHDTGIYSWEILRKM